MNNLTVVSTIENDSLGILDLMVQSVFKFTTPKPSIILCNQRPLVQKLNYSGVQVVKYDPKISGGSNRHGYSLNRVLKEVKTKRVAVVEPDCVILSDNWFKSDKKLLAAKKAEAFGRTMYHVCFFVGETELLKNVDFTPGQSPKSGMAYKVFKDVGWRLCDHVNDKSVEHFKYIDCKSGDGKVLGKEFQSDEFWKDGVPVAVHFGRGSNISGKAIRKGFKHPRAQLEGWLYKVKKYTNIKEKK